MAIQPRQIAGMVEESMGAGGPGSMDDDKQIEVAVEEEMESMPEGVEMMDEEVYEIEAEEYDHNANIAEGLEDDGLGD